MLTTRNIDPCLSNPDTTPADLLIPDRDEAGVCTIPGDSLAPQDPGYTIATSPGKGMGLFATRFIPAHARILEERPVLTLPAGGGIAGKDQMLGPSDLQGLVAQVFSLSPMLRDAVMNLQGERVTLWRPQMEHYREILRNEAFSIGGGKEEEEKRVAAGDGEAGLSRRTIQGGTIAKHGRILSPEEQDRLEHVLRVFYTNAAALVGPLRLPSPSSPSQQRFKDVVSTGTSAAAAQIGHVGDGLFLTFSRINHSCEANAVWDTYRKPGVMSIRAARDIHPGEEITISYFWETEDAVETRRERTKGWGFICQCLKCGPVLAES